MIKLILKILIIIFIVSCNEGDVGLYPSKNNHHRVEFDIVKNNLIEKKIGVASIGINDPDNLDEIELHFQGIYQGEYFVNSNECGINYKSNYKGLEKIKLKDIVKKNNVSKCLLKIKFKSDYIKEYKYQFEETAEIYLIFENFYKNFGVSYNNLENSRNYFFKDNNAIQIRSSKNISKNKITLHHSSIKNWEYYVTGCGSEISGVTSLSKINISFERIFNKNETNRSDSCLLSIEIKNFDNNSQKIFLFISIFDAETKILDNLNYEIKNGTIIVNGFNFSNICSINNTFKLFTCFKDKVICTEIYEDDKVYWLREITLKGRKNILGIKNGQLVWEE